jgi:glycosyltransferase involved in cell wall biosynthesis
MTPNDAYERYRDVRDAVLRVKARAAGSDAGAPSDYWAEELANIDYMIEASPLVVAKLRHHAFQITGIRPYDYRIQDDARREAFEGRLHALIELGGEELVVPEHEALGGFGYQLPRGLFNVDTIKFLEVLVAMKRGGVLETLTQAGSPPTVLEIGAGWGGFAYQLKTLVPAARYVIVDFPELFLFSATYLRTVFPAARIAMLGQGDDEEAAVAGADFVFVPNADAARVIDLAPDVAINMVSFQEMTSAQVRGYAALAHASGCRWLYSLNRERSRYNTQLTAVSTELSDHYELRDVHVLETGYTSAMRKVAPAKPRASTKVDASNELAYRHIVGRRRDQPRGEGPLVGIGATTFNRAAHLPQALDSILAQTYPHFRLVIVDDGSSDDTDRIAREYAQRDARVVYVRHETRQGMAATWRHAFEAATGEPSVEYFAWASDHDVWAPAWLESLVAELDWHPEAVLAYPHTRRIDERGRLLEKPARLFTTAGMADLDARWRFVCRELVASGDMVYGLARVKAMKLAGVFRDVLCPDRLLMAELALQGEFRQLPGELWHRRQFGESSVARQRTSLFAGAPPSVRWLPVWYQHSRVLWREYVSDEADPLRRRQARRQILRYGAVYALRHHQKSTTHKAMFAVYWWLRGGWKKAKHYTLLGLFYTLVYGRRAYHRTVYEVALLTRRIGLR